MSSVRGLSALLQRGVGGVTWGRKLWACCRPADPVRWHPPGRRVEHKPRLRRQGVAGDDRGSGVYAVPGDWLVVKGTTVGAADEVGQILGVRREDGTPPYLVKWLHDGHEALVFPGPDAHVVPAADMEREDARKRNRIAEVQRAIVRGSRPPRRA
ncbi:DUF1918 domain-containing protein [Rhodococcus sp. NPDC004095]